MLRSGATDSGARSGADYLTWEYMRNRSHAKHDLSATVAATQEDKMWVQGSDRKWRKSNGDEESAKSNGGQQAGSQAGVGRRGTAEGGLMTEAELLRGTNRTSGMGGARGAASRAWEEGNYPFAEPPSRFEPKRKVYRATTTIAHNEAAKHSIRHNEAYSPSRSTRQADR